ncbi:MAG: hypothetical protein MI748_03355 [Opitutales bacterium]|nr:hypothetical protein [Opitutales bacterium]
MAELIVKYLKYSFIGLCRRGILPLTLLFSGCISNPPPNLPDTWIPRSTPLADSDIEDGEIPKIHIFIMYGKLIPLHTALRVYSPELGAVFWDPEGGYGKKKKGPKAKRVKDVVVDPVPTVKDYLKFREVNPTQKTEVFEFHVDVEIANKLIRMLTPENDGEIIAYETDVEGPFCSSSISKFLTKHSDQTVQTPKVCLPQTFSKYLYQQNPDRVIIADDDIYIEYGPGPEAQSPNTSF